MKKKFLLTIIATLMVTCGVFAQSNLIATLSHEGVISYYYGVNALQEAHDAAQDGDVITLSSGGFRSATLSKSITVRGAGMNSVGDLSQTSVEEFTIADGAKNINIEGMYFRYILSAEGTSSAIHFSKCKIGDLRDSQRENWSFDNCIILWSSLSKPQTVFFTNSIVFNIGTFSDEAVQTYYNCVVFILIAARSNIYYNCILMREEDGHGNDIALISTTTCKNCLSIGGMKGMDFGWVPDAAANGNVHVNTYTEVFKSYNGGKYQDGETFELTDDAKANYLGDDGKEVGIYGGEAPFNTVLSYPQFTKATVASKAENGKLSVNIELNGGN